MRMIVRFFPLLVLMLALTGCAGGSGASSTGVGVNASQYAALEPAPAIGGGPLKPQSLLGVAPSALSARLGAPALKRTEPDAEVWQYSGGDCALFVYFYKTGHGALASTYVDARKKSGGAASTEACLADVIKAQGTPVS